MTDTPSRVEIRMYNVGFGDCFGLRFSYDDESVPERHIVIDCGTMALPQSGGKARYSMLDVAKDIAAWSRGSLDAIVVSHRHQDHLSGFAGRAGEVFRDLRPKLIVQPWTEEPELPVDATEPIPAAGLSGAQAFTTALAGQQAFVDYVFHAVAGDGAMSAELSFLGQNNIKNRAAVENLIDMGRTAQGEFLSHGQPTRLENLLPGVKVHVLGPPTVEEWKPITRQRHEDDVEFWHLVGSHAPAVLDGKAEPVFRHGSFRVHVPPNARWLTKHIDEVREDLLFPIVRALDDALNNTSLILLFEVGSGADRKLLLFPGDAQIENWEYVFQGPSASDWKLLLADVDVYKVGHHGSLNATPKSGLWPRFVKKGSEDYADRMWTLLSTRGAVHGHYNRKTEVPRQTLVHELDRHTQLTSTQRQRKMAKDFVLTFGV